MTRGSVMDYLKAIRERYLRAGAVRNGGRQLSACCTKGRLCLARSDGEAGDGMVLR